MMSKNYVAAELRLDLSFEAVSGEARQMFESNFRQDVALLAQVELSQVVVDGIRAGSLIVSFRILSAAPGSPSTSPSDALDFLEQSLTQPVRLENIGVEVDSSVLVVVAHVDEAGNSVPAATDTPRSDTSDTTAYTGSTGADQAVALPLLLLLGSLLGCAVAAIFFRRCKRTRGTGTQVADGTSDLTKLHTVRFTPPPTPDTDLELQASQHKIQSVVRGIVNARTTANGQREFKVRWADGQHSWVPSESVSAEQIALFEHRKSRSM